jgi:hypothetical protein
MVEGLLNMQPPVSPISPDADAHTPEGMAAPKLRPSGGNQASWQNLSHGAFCCNVSTRFREQKFL